VTDTRTALLDAALGLFAEQGVELPSMREITRAAEQRNTNALQYHFNDRQGLLRDLLNRHGDTVDQHRDALLGEIGTDNELRPVAAALVVPLADLLRSAQGAEYLQLTSELVARPSHFREVVDLVTQRPSLLRWSHVVEPFLPPQAIGRPLHRRFTAIRFVHNELGSRARERQSRADHRLFTSHLTDLVCGLLTAPVSPETAGFIDSR
jgi:AcrR family transcriptional regulator